MNRSKPENFTRDLLCVEFCGEHLNGDIPSWKCKGFENEFFELIMVEVRGGERRWIFTPYRGSPPQRIPAIIKPLTGISSKSKFTYFFTLILLDYMIGNGQFPFFLVRFTMYHFSISFCYLTSVYLTLNTS